MEGSVASKKGFEYRNGEMFIQLSFLCDVTARVEGAQIDTSIGLEYALMFTMKAA